MENLERPRAGLMRCCNRGGENPPLILLAAVAVAGQKWLYCEITFDWNCPSDGDPIARA